MAYKISQNLIGRFYVDSNCINCLLCSEIAPENFMANHHKGYVYIYRQPENDREKTRIQEAMILCPSSAINDNGK